MSTAADLKRRATDEKAEADAELLRDLGRLHVKFPHRSRVILQLRADLEREMARTDESDQELIADAVRVGAWTLREIREETGLSDQDVRAHLRVMADDGRVTIDREGTTEAHRGPARTIFKPGPKAIR